jgi:hypothetical protein
VKHFVIVGLAAVLALGSGGSVWAQETLCQFILTRNELTALALSGDYHHFQDRYFDDRSSVSAGQLVLEGLAWSEGPEWSYSVDGSARLRFSRAAITVDSALGTEGQLRRYVRENLFLFGGVDTAGFPGQQGLTVSVLGGAGLGRFVNVTPMVKALQVSQVLWREGILTQEPSSAQLQELAQIIGRQRELGLAGTLQEIETLLGRSLNVSAVLELQQILTASITRFCGWDMSLGLGYDVIDPTGQHAALLQGRANYALPLGAGHQLLISLRSRAPFPFTGAYTLNTTVGYQRLLTPTTDLNAQYMYRLSRDAGGFVTITHTVNLALRLQVQPDLGVTLQGQASSGTGFEKTEWGFTVGFQYDLF